MHRLFAPFRIVLRNADFRALLVCNVLLGLTYSFVAPFLSMWGTRAVGMSPLRFGVFMTVTSVAAIAISTVLARWSDTRYSRRTMLLLGGVTGAIGFVGYAYCTNFWLLVVIGSLPVAVSAITFSQLFAHARDLLAASDVPRSDTPLYINVFRLFFALAWTVGPALGAWTLHLASYRGTFLAAAACFVVFTGFVYAQVRDVPPRDEAREAAAGVPLWRAMTEPTLLAHFVGLALFYCCFFMGVLNLPLLILETLRGEELQVGFAYSVAPIFELPFMLALGVLATRVDHAALIRAALSVAVVYYGLLSLVGAVWHVYLLQVLSALVVSVTSGVAITFFQDFLPNQAGTATNLYSNATRLGQTTGYLLFGVLAAGGDHRLVFRTCCALSLAACALLFAFRRRRGQTFAISSPVQSGAGPGAQPL
ncbi:MAG: sugar efflux transporter [Planctomycetota bacterium]